MPSETYYVATATLTVAALAFIIRALLVLITKRSGLHLWMVASALVGAFTEVIYDALTFVQFFPAAGTPKVYVFWGHNEVPFLFPAWIVWFSSMGFTAFTVARSRSPRARMWKLLVACSAADIVGELVLMHAGIYTYYEPWPFRVFGRIPFHLTVYMAAACLATALILSHLHARLTGYQKLFLLPMAGGVTLAGLVFSSWPVVLAVAVSLPPVVTNLLGALSMALTLGMFSVVVRLLPNTAVEEGAS
ncbi:hypothetical protein ACSNOH_06140 [Streptomyces sp. URMC 127]|uniref:hypothetical protein n=1 Tax=Streptomyces sp. URMC 127 TaxID=3423402 RepID=UPI003F1DEA8C